MFVITVISVSFSNSDSIDKYCQWICIIIVVLGSIFVVDPIRILLTYQVTNVLMKYKWVFNRTAHDSILRHRLLKTAYDKVNDSKLHLIPEPLEITPQIQVEAPRRPELDSIQEV